MKNKAIPIAAITLFILIGAFALLSSDSGTSPAQEVITSEITVDRVMHDFGDIDIFSGEVQSDFTLSNRGKEDVIVVSATTSCGCTEGLIAGLSFGMHKRLASSITIAAGETETLTAIYDPLAHGPNATGAITRQLFLRTNSEVTPEIEIRISANVTKDE